MTSSVKFLALYFSLLSYGGGLGSSLQEEDHEDAV